MSLSISTMKRTAFILAISALVSCGAETVTGEQAQIDFNRGWKFSICEGTAILETPTTVFVEEDGLEVPYGCALPLPEDGPSILAQSKGPADSQELAEKDFDDSAWRVVDLPHDWAVEGDFNRFNPATTNGGALPGGVGWYRKTFVVSNSLEGKNVYLNFDGVYMNSRVWVNGQEVGTRPYGYISFSYDITPYLIYGKENTIAVRVDNSDQPNSRWYSGCGIFRKVTLRVADCIHVANWGVYARCIKKNELAVSTTLVNGSKDQPEKIEVLTELLDDNGVVVSYAKSAAGGDLTCEQTLPLHDPNIWSLTSPYLYNLKTTVLVDGKPVDTCCNNVGIRTIEFDPDKGFFLNGEHVKLNGVCLHHDLGALGSAVNRSALKRQLTIMKEMGVNSVRCSHNPPSLELLDLCDEMGILVMDEAFDMWRQRKTERDYARFFEQWHERDLTDLVVRDRNHPCIIMWSIGNEVLELWSNASADTLSIEQANFILNFGHSADQLAKEKEMSVNSLLTAKLADIVHKLDPTRPVTAGCNEPDPGNHLFRSGALDIIGYNYHDQYFMDVPKNFPGKPFLVSESVSSLMTRGYYAMPSDVKKICPPMWSDPHAEPSFACSAYDNYHVPWGSTNEETLTLVEHNDFIGGQYLWTGFDYIGEPIPYSWPARSSYFGIVDLAGFPKDVYYMYQSVWRKDIDVLHVFPHWNWNEGDIVDVWTYYNNADCVELFVNGVSAGKRRKISYAEVETGKIPSTPMLDMSTEYHCCWRIPYSPGEIRAVSYKDGNIVAEKTIRTAGAPASLKLTVDRTEIMADGYEMAFVSVEVLDKDGNLCPYADNDVKFNVKGPGKIAGVDNGSPITLERFKADHRKAFHGKCLVIVQNIGKAGTVHVEASSDGLEGQCEFSVINQ